MSRVQFNSVLLKLLISFFLLLINVYEVYAGVKKKEPVYYSNQQMTDEQSWNNMDHFPKPKKSDQEMVALMKSSLIYPEIAKKKFLGHNVLLELTIDTAGKIASIGLLSNPVPIFDTAAIHAIKATQDIWQSGYVGNKKKQYEITIPINFFTKYHDDQVYYDVSMFYNFDTIVIDSTNTYPAMLEAYYMRENLPYEDVKEYYYPINQVRLWQEELWTINRDYGKVEIGVEIDEHGKAVQYQVMTSFAPALDSEALNQLKEYNWIPAHKNGIKVPCFKYFNIVFGNYLSISNWIRDGYYSYSFTLIPKAILDFRQAEIMYKEGKYSIALDLFNKVSNWYNFDPEIFYDKALTEVQLKKGQEACADFQRSYELAEDFGYPIGMQKSQIEKILTENCQ